MPGNQVTVVVGSQNNTTVDLDELKRRLDELKNKRADIAVNVKDAAAKAQLDKLDVQIMVLQRRLDSAKLGDLGAARAVAGISAVDLALDRMEHKAAGGGLLRGMFSGRNLGGAAGGLGAIGGIFAGGGGLLAMAGPLAAATAAMGAFGAVAIPVLSKVSQAQSALSTAQQAYAAATTPAQRAAALKAEAKATSGLSDAQKGLLGPLGQIKQAFSGLENVATPALGSLLKLGVSLMPLFGGLVRAGGALVGALAGPLDRLLKSAGFAQFLKTLESLAGQMGAVLGPVLVQLVRLFMQLTVQLGPVGVQLLKVLLPAIVQLATDLVPFLLLGAKLVNVLAQWLDKNKLLVPALALLTAGFIAMKMSLLTNPIFLVATAIITLAFIIDKYHKTIWSFITRIWGDIFGFLKGIWNSIVAFAKQWWLVALLGPVGLIVKYHNDIWAFMRRIWNDIVGWFKTLPGKIVGAMSALGGLLYNLAKGAMQSLWNGAKALWNDVTGFFTNLGKAILNGVKSILGISSPSSAFHSVGVNIMRGLLSGLKSEAGHVLGWMENLASSALGKIVPAFGGSGLSNSANQNMVLMQQMAKARGWTGDQWTALFNVEMAEADFNMFAKNPGSGAYGMAQFINGPSEYYQYGGNPNTASGQITGMLNYIAQRYGNPGAAWAHEQAFHWYDQGGWLPPGVSVAVNQTGRPERVLGPGEGIQVHISLDRSVEQGLGADLLKRLRFDVRTKGGGNVQALFGGG